MRSYNTFEISQEIKAFFKKEKGIIMYGGICKKAGVTYFQIADLMCGRSGTLSREYINKLLPHLYQYGFYSSKLEIDLAYIQTKVCRYFNIPVDQVKSESRDGDIVEARRYIFKLGREIAKLTLSKIGAEIGGRDHVTVSHGINTLNNLIETERKTKLHYLALEKRLKQA